MGNDVALSPSKSIGVQASSYKVGDVLKLVIHGYGGISNYFEDNHLNPTDRLVEVEVKSVKAVKKQEFLDA